jgi:hypothetical protein
MNPAAEMHVAFFPTARLRTPRALSAVVYRKMVFLKWEQKKIPFADVFQYFS